MERGHRGWAQAGSEGLGEDDGRKPTPAPAWPVLTFTGDQVRKAGDLGAESKENRRQPGGMLL